MSVRDQCYLISVSKIVFSFLILCVLLLILLSFSGTILVYILPDEELQSTRIHGGQSIMTLVNALNVDKERSISTWFSSMILSLSGLISASIGFIHLRLKIKRGFHWISIGIIFFYISMDESLGIHEIAIDPFREITQAGGIFYFAWIIPALLILVILAIVYKRFIFDLPAMTRNLLLISAAVYLGGAIGMEMVGGYYLESNNEEVDFIYSVIVTVEEFMELMGTSIYIYALLRHIETSRCFGIFLQRRIDS